MTIFPAACSLYIVILMILELLDLSVVEIVGAVLIIFTLVAVLFPVLLMGMTLGHHLHIKINQKKFNQIISVMLMISGVILMYKALKN